MAPTRSALGDISTRPTNNKVIPLARRPISTRAQQTKLGVLGENAHNLVSAVTKRKADNSPVQNERNVKRAALGNVTNALLNAKGDNKKLTQRTKAAVAQKSNLPIASKKSAPQPINDENAGPKVARAGKVATRASLRVSDARKPAAALATISEATNGMQQVKISTAVGKQPKAAAVNVKPKVELHKEEKPNMLSQKTRRNSRRLSTEFGFADAENSHYMSALEDLTNSRVSIGLRRISTCSTVSNCSSDTFSTIGPNETALVVEKTLSTHEEVPEGVVDFDRENWDDPYQVSEYAMDIFSYLKQRESEFIIKPYLDRQPQLTVWMRTLLVDWMVEVQETFELNHETLYLAVKIVDIFLSKVTIQKENLQLVGAAAMFIACKYDERIPTSIEDFIYICDNAYTQNELIRMEMNAFRVIGYDLGIPLSYRFLRRYARCGKITMPELTLARFILEFSLMNYEMVTISDSKVAAACLFIALRMNDKTGWNKQLQYYSGYKVDDFRDIVKMLNEPLHAKQSANKTIRTKYAHKVFFQVSKIPLMTNDQLFDGSDSIGVL